MKIPASKVPAQVWADKARRRADLDEEEGMLLSSWDDSKQVYRIGKELWDELRIDEADEVPVDALLRLPYGCIFIERRWVDEYEQLLTDDMADTSEELNVVRKANESMSYACEVTDEELLMTAHSRSYLLEHILGSLLYISSKEADVRTVYVPQKKQSRKSRQTDCTVHDVGFRIAPQLAEVRRVYEHEAKGQDGGKTGRHVAPHVRRGHWHGYWTGPRENPTGLEIKWVAPTVVNASRGELEGTVHEVGGRDA